jgi:nanoRNase/pAp phosphatase (c-di-AMP/oligoRNAs hydrolase)
MKQQYDIIIDHHPVTDQLQANFLDIREDYGANSSIMAEYLKAGKIKPSSKLATALFYGIKTDTHNFVRATISHDMDAFKYLYRFTSLRILRKIESSEMTRGMLFEYRRAMERLIFIGDIAFVHMERVDNPDLLVLIADFFMKIAEIQWSIVSGAYQKYLEGYEVMKIIVPTVGAVPHQRTAGYIIDIAKRLNTQFVVLRILSEDETEAAGEQSLSLFIENGKKKESAGEWNL